MKKSYFIVQNLTNTTIILPDLRGAEIAPNKKLDLEKVARRIDIERSLDLVKAIKASLLRIVKRSSWPQKINPADKIRIERPYTKDELSEAIQKATEIAMKRAIEKGQTLDVTKLHETIQRQVAHSIDGQFDDRLDHLLKQKQAKPDDKFDAVLEAIKALKESLPAGGVAAESRGPEVDIEELAKIAQKGVEKISSKISQPKDQPKKSKRIKLDTQASDLAKELE